MAAVAAPGSGRTFPDGPLQGQIRLPLDQLIDRLDLFEKRLEGVERQGARPVAKRLIGIRVRLEEETGDFLGDPGLGQPQSALPAAAGGTFAAAGDLEGMGHVENHGCPEGLHHPEAQHIDNQVVVAEGDPPFAEKNPFAPRFSELRQDVPHVLRGEKLPLFDLDDRSRPREGCHEVGLAAQEGGQLQDVADLRRGGRLVRLVDIGQDRNPETLPHFGQESQSLFQSGAAIGVDRRPVRLVERPLENIRNAKAAGDIDHVPGDLHRQVAGFKHVDPGNQNERSVVGEMERIAQRNFSSHSGHRGHRVREDKPTVLSARRKGVTTSAWSKIGEHRDFVRRRTHYYRINFDIPSTDLWLPPRRVGRSGFFFAIAGAVPHALSDMNIFEWLLTVLFLTGGIGLLLYGLNCYWQIYFFLRGRKFLARQSVDADRIEGELWAEPDSLPMVTTQIPLYNEFNVAARILRAVAAIDYPIEKHQIQVLDDSDDATRGLIDRIAGDLRRDGHWVEVFRREKRTGFKAGALKAGLEKARGEFVAIFDGDFVPRADFLRKTLPPLVRDGDLGLVQGRWGHLNPRENLLCRAQSIGIDGHFAIEQSARASNGFFLNFNGTAGLWRKRAILESGNWEGDTLTEDMDLSYRAQLAGWRLAFRGEAVVPAELPASFTAFKNQQFRWAKGSIQTAKKLFPRVLRSDRPRIARLQAFLHLTHYGIHPFIVLVAVLSLPVLFFLPERVGPLVRMAGAACVLVAALGPNFLYLISQRTLYPDRWRRKILLLPALTIVGLGISLSNSRGVIEGLLGIKSGFVRTPKRGSAHTLRYRARGSRLVAVELFLAGYCLLSFALYSRAGVWGMSPFLLLYAAGYSFVGIGSLLEIRESRSAPGSPTAATNAPAAADASSPGIAG